MATLDLEFRVKGFSIGQRQTDSMTLSITKLEKAVNNVDFSGLGKKLENISSLFKNATKSINDFKGSLSKTTNVGAGLEGFSDSLIKAKTATEEQRKKTEEARTATQKARQANAELTLSNRQNKQSIDAASGSYREAQQRLTFLGNAIKNTEGGFRNMTPAVRAQISEYRNLNNQLKSFDAKMGNHQRNVGNYGSAIAGAIPYIQNFTTVAGLAALAVAGLQKSFSTNLKLDALDYSIKQVSGTSENFTKNMEFLRSTADRLGLDFVSTAEAFKTWQGAAKFSNLTSEESRKVFESVANAGAKMKLSTDNVRGAFLALSQMMSKGKVQAEELRGQLGERLPGAFALAAKAMGVTEQELNKMLEKGQVVSNEFLPKFAEQLDIAFGNDKTQKIESLQASVNRMNTEFDLLFRSENMTKFFTAAYEGFALMANQINRMINSKDWKEFKAIAFGSVEEHQKYVDKRDLNRGQRFLKGTGFDKKEVSDQKKIISDIQKGLNGAVKAYNEFYKTSASDGLSIDQAGKKYQQLADNVKMYSDALSEANIVLKSQGAFDKKEIITPLGDEKKKSVGKPALVSDILSDLSGVGFNEYDAKLKSIEVEYEKLVQKIKTSTGSGADIAKALNLAGAKRDFETLKVEVGRFVDEVKKIPGYKGKNSVSLSGVLNNPMQLPGLTQAQERINKATRSGLSKEEKDLEKKLGRVVERGFRQGLDNLYDNIANLGSNFQEVFSNAFRNLAGNFSKVFQDLVATQLGDKFNKAFDSDKFQLGGLSNNISKALVAGASMAGGLLSSIGSQRSYVAQGAGGALSGAGAGAAIGSVIPGLGTVAGALIGGALGALSGIFGASSARKQEQIQQEQLLEQKKQTRLLEFQSSLAYTSSIIGQKTNQGIVTGFDRDSIGNLTARVSGRDIEFILGREGGSR